MKTAALAFAASLAVAGAAAAQEHDHPHGDHGAHGAAPAATPAAQEDHAGHGEHAHDAAHFATARHAEHRLRDTIAAMQAGTLDYATMGPELAEAVRAQSATMQPTLASWGELQTLEHLGEPVAGAHQFGATFANGQFSVWTIRIDGEDKIQGLMVQ